MAAQPRDTEKKCPKCGSRTFRVLYEDIVSMANRVVDGRWSGAFAEDGMPRRKAAYGDCARCGHDWQFRDGYID